MIYSVVFSPIADKDPDSLSSSMVRRISNKIASVAEDPRRHAKPLKGLFPPVYSFRVGDYRVLFGLDDEIREMKVLLVRHGSEVYRVL